MRNRVIALLLPMIMTVSVAARAGELGGLLLNETRTFAGQAFFAAFSETWRALDPDSRYTLVVTERPSARTGSQITVRYGSELMFQQFVPFHADKAAAAGRIATGPVFDRVIGAEVNSLFIDPDLAPDEFLPH